MTKKAYDPHLKASVYGQGGMGASGYQSWEVKAQKKGWMDTRKERKGSPGRGERSRSKAFERSG